MPAGGLPAHDPLGGRVAARQYLPLRARSEPPSQELLAKGCTKISFTMQIFRRDASQQFGQVVFPGANGVDHNNAPLFTNINLIVQTQSGGLHNPGRNADGCTVTPLFDSYQHVDLLVASMSIR